VYGIAANDTDIKMRIRELNRVSRRTMSYLSKRRLLLALAFMSLACSMHLHAQVGGAIKYIKVDGKAAGPTSNSGVLAGKTLYVAGQDGRNADGALPKDFPQEVSQALSNVQGMLRAAGMDFGNVVTMNIYLTHVSDVDGMNTVYWKTIGSDPPARTVLAIAGLPNGANIEINCIAVSSAAKRVVIHPQGWPQGPHIDPAAIQADDVLYMSAQYGVDPLTGKIAADFPGEVKQSMQNVAAVAKAANLTLENLIWVNPYMSTVGSNERAMNTGYASNFQIGNLPGRGTFTVVDLPNGNHMAFTCIAGADLSKRKIIRPRNEGLSRTSSPGNLYDDTAYYSAKDAFVPGLGYFPPELDIQTRLSMRNLLDGLETVDIDFLNVASATIYMRDVADADKVQDIYGLFFKGNFPARTTLAQNLDLKAEDVEQISFIAVRDPQAPPKTNTAIKSGASQ
jgi:enamine deaminase RidA (YjgF/YER057c/UK114 family)